MCLLRIWCRQILLALSFLHESNVILLRLRPTNILVSPCGRCIKIASLDGAGHIDGPFVICSDDARKKSEVLNDAYMPPEMLHADGSRVQPCTFFGDAAFRPSKEVDSWCFGCLMLEMASGRSPVSYGTLLQRTLDSHTAPPTALLPYIFLDAFGFCEDGDSSSARGERVLLSPPPTWKCTSNTVSWTSLASMQIALGAKTLGPLLAFCETPLDSVVLAMRAYFYALRGNKSDGSDPCRAMLEVADADSDGLLSFSELKQALLFDAGFPLSDSELDQIAQRLPKHAGKYFRRRLQIFDMPPMAKDGATKKEYTLLDHRNLSSMILLDGLYRAICCSCRCLKCQTRIMQTSLLSPKDI